MARSVAEVQAALANIREARENGMREVDREGFRVIWNSDSELRTIISDLTNELRVAQATESGRRVSSVRYMTYGGRGY
jgi:hypothetical protein